MTHELQNQLAVITGGGRGIGQAIALALAEVGASVCLLGRNAANLQQVCEQIIAGGGTAHAYMCDISASSAVQTVFERIRAERGPVAVLVNNAGMTASVKFTAMDDALWEQIMRVNVTGPYFCCKAVVPDMIAQGRGRIINIASIAALTGIPYSVAYSASKHALLGLTRALALELARYHITVNAICPGWVETDMVHEAVANVVDKTGRSADEARASILQLSNQPRIITPEEVAAVVVRLGGPDGAGTTGEAVVMG